MNPATYTATLNGHALHLTASCFDVLYQLAAHPQQVFSRNELHQTVWGREPGSIARTADMVILRIRRALGEHAGLVETVRGRGWRLALHTDVAIPPPAGVPALYTPPR